MRRIPAELVERYEREGYWTRETLGDMLADGLKKSPDAGFYVHSAMRPYSGTFGDVEHDARQLDPCGLAVAAWMPASPRSPRISGVPRQLSLGHDIGRAAGVASGRGEKSGRVADGVSV